MDASYKPPFPPLVGNRQESFAYITLRDRLPVICTKLVDRTHRYLLGNPAESDQLKAAIEQLSALRYQLQCNKPLTPLEAIPQQPSVNDLDEWNTAIGEQFAGLGWFDVPWLFAECYWYRRVRHIFDQCGLPDFDYFLGDKQDSFQAAKPDIVAVCTRLDRLLLSDPVPNRQTLQIEFHEFLQNSLWGNQHDLSMDADRSADEIHSNRHRDKQHAADNFLIANDHPQLTQWLAVSDFTVQTPDATLHIILDNTGAELVMDLCLADWLMNRAKWFDKAVFHCKCIPWFVSDTLPSDIPWTLDALERVLSFSAETPATVQRWREMFASGRWQMRPDPFWTSYRPYDHLPLVAPHLIKDFTSDPRNMCIFKGDLNYRKLVYDCQWPFSTPFRLAVGNRLSDAMQSIPLVALRTCKSDVVSGVDDETAERLDREAGKNIGAKGWLVTGRYAVMQVIVK